MAGTQASSRPGPSARIRSAPMPLALHPAQDTPPKTRGRASGFLLSDRDRLDHLDPVAGDAAAIGNDLDPGGARGFERLAIGRIDVAGELETLRRPDLDQEQHYRARACCDHRAQFAELLRPALGNRVGQFCPSRLAHQVHVLDLEIAWWPRRMLEQKIDP